MFVCKRFQKSLQIPHHLVIWNFLLNVFSCRLSHFSMQEPPSLRSFGTRGWSFWDLLALLLSRSSKDLLRIHESRWFWCEDLKKYQRRLKIQNTVFGSLWFAQYVILYLNLATSKHQNQDKTKYFYITRLDSLWLSA